MYASSHKFTTVPLFLSALTQYGIRRWGADYRLPRGTTFQAAFTGMRHYYGPAALSVPKAALTMEDLHAFHQLLDRRYYEHARDWCAYLFAFFALLRINEYMGGRLRHRHVRVYDGGLDITVMFSKTDQSPATVSLAARADELCPARAYRQLLSTLIFHGFPRDPDTPVFLSRLDTGALRREPTSDEELVRSLRAVIAVARPDSDPMRYAGHSFRRGGTSAMLLAGVHPSVIQRHGRWRSDSWRRYIDEFENPAIRLLATSSLPQRCARTSRA